MAMALDTTTAMFDGLEADKSYNLCVSISLKVIPLDGGTAREGPIDVARIVILE